MTLLEKAPTTSPDVVLTGPQKAAILLVILGEEASAHVAKLLTEEELKIAGRSIAELPLITPQQSQAVLEEFYQRTVAHNHPYRGGANFARRVIVTALGRDGSRHLVSELKLGEPEGEDSSALRQTHPQQLARLIEREHPQTIAIILSHLGSTQAAGLLAALDRPLRAKVVIRIATLDNVSDDLVRKVIGVVADRVKSLGEITPGGPIGGARSAAELLNAMDPQLSNEILEDVRETKDELEQSIRNCMFVFDDLLSIDIKGIKELVARIDRKVLTVSLKGATDELKKHILSCMSQRGAEMINEDIEAMGPVKIKEVESAQQQIITVVRVLQTEGVLSTGSSGDDQYVE